MSLLAQLLAAIASGGPQQQPRATQPELRDALIPGAAGLAPLPRDPVLDQATGGSLEAFYALSTTEQLRMIERALADLPPEQVTLIQGALRHELAKPWLPLPGPQTMAYNSKADVLLYGGAAGGGKSDLAVGLATTAHKRSLICRREYGELDFMRARVFEISGGRIPGYNGQDDVFQTKDGRRIEFFAAKHPGDEQKQQGQPKDLLVIDEAVHWNRAMVRYLMGWVRTTDKGQRCRVVLCTNPPTSYQSTGDGGQWLMKMFAPWLDPGFPDPAMPGELRWSISDKDGEDLWVDGPGDYPVGGLDDLVPARSRTFVPAKIDDNPYLAGSDYKSTLLNMDEPMRSIMLKGDWLASSADNAWQVIPTEWVKAAQTRWQQRADMRPGPPPGKTMTSLAVDASFGGADETVIAARYSGWFAPLVTRKGIDTKDTGMMAGLVFGESRDACQIVVDLGGGWGGGVFGRLKEQQLAVDGFMGVNPSMARTQDGRAGFLNLRAETIWKFREALDPANNSVIELPPDPALAADLAAPRWQMRQRGGTAVIQIESKEDIRKRLGRSTDRGDAVTMCYHYGGLHEMQAREMREQRVTAVLGYANVKPRVNLGGRRLRG